MSETTSAPDTRSRKGKWQFQLGSIFWFQLAVVPLFVGISLRNFPSRPPTTAEMVAGIALVYVLPAVYAASLSVVSIRSLANAGTSWMGIHALRGLQFGILYGALLFSGIIGLEIWEQVRPRPSRPYIDRHAWDNVRIESCIGVCLTFFSGLEGCAAGAVAGWLRLQKASG